MTSTYAYLLIRTRSGSAYIWREGVVDSVRRIGPAREGLSRLEDGEWHHWPIALYRTVGRPMIISWPGEYRRDPLLHATVTSPIVSIDSLPSEKDCVELLAALVAMESESPDADPHP